MHLSNMTMSSVIAVTGAESGIGAACAVAFAGPETAIAVLYHQDAGAAALTVRAVERSGGRALAVPVDVAGEAAVESAFDRIEQAFGTVDILVNSAGLNQSGVTVAKMDLAQWQRLITTDLTGAFLTSRRMVRSLHAAKRGGAIVNISSIHATDVRAGAADYCAAKAGLERLTQVMALEEAPSGIRVNAIAPGMILTPMNGQALADADYRRALEANIPIGRAGTAEEVAGLALWLASPAAAYITGASIVMDGGLSLVLGQNA